jgi:hypothetical protein
MVVLAAMLFTGCSKSSSEQTHQAHPIILTNLTNLGAITVSDQPKVFSLKAGKSLQISGRQTPDGVDMKLVVMMTNADGILAPIPRSEIEIRTCQGQHMAHVFDDVSVMFIATVK